MRKIAITGPESTGKSELAKKLAEHYGTIWVPEYAREYLENIGRPYIEPDILSIAKGQKEREALAEPLATGILFCDTELLVTKIWSEVRYDRCAPWIIENLQTDRYDLYLLCDIDLPWEYDPLREHPDARQFLFDRYFNDLTAMKAPFAVVRGTGPVRLGNAVRIIESKLGIM